METDPIYEFGHGLSYTTFEYGPLTLSASEVCEGQELTANVTVTNRGDRTGAETVFWYLRDPEASVTQPIRRLIHFEKIDLAPGETKTASLKVDQMTHLAYPDNNGKRVLERGRFVIEASRKCDAEFRLI